MPVCDTPIQPGQRAGLPVYPVSLLVVSPMACGAGVPERMCQEILQFRSSVSCPEALGCT